MWRDCGQWQTGEFDGYPELSNQSFAHAYERAPDALLAWVKAVGRHAVVRWFWDFAHYVRHRSKAEGRDLGVPRDALGVCDM